MVGNGDFQKVQEIYDKYWKGNLEVPPTIGRLVECIVEDDEGNIVCYGMMRLVPEVFMIMDQSKSTRQKSEALDLLLQTARMSAVKHSFPEFNLLTSNESYSKVLQKHYGFKEVPAILLRLKLEE